MNSMKAIETHYLPCTYKRPARIVAVAEGGNRVVITHPGGVGVMPHALAARKLCAKLKWTGKLTAGTTAKGYVFAWVTADTMMRVTTDGSATLPTEIDDTCVLCDTGEEHEH